MSTNEDGVVSYRLDPSRSQFIVRGSAGGMLSMFGHDPVIAVCGFGGDARMRPDTLESASLLMLVQANSLAVLNKISDKDKREMERAMWEDVLEIASYPEIIFMSTSITVSPAGAGRYRAGIVGKLSLHGVTRVHSMDAQLTVSDDSLRAQGEFSLLQSDYNIKPVSAVGGTLKMKDELKFSFDIMAGRS